MTPIETKNPPAVARKPTKGFLSLNEDTQRNQKQTSDVLTIMRGTQQMVSYVEKSVSIPTTATLYRLAEALGTTPGVILASVDAVTIRPKVKPGETTIRHGSKEDSGSGLVAEEPPGKTKRVSKKRPSR